MHAEKNHLPSGSRIRAWLQLVRVPNLLTVPGDPLAGYLIAVQALYVSAANLSGAVLAALCFYMAGLIMNDLFDLEEDQRERPGRPLPSGRIGLGPAVVACTFLILIGAVICYASGLRAIWVGCALVAAIIAYNRYSKTRPLLGPLNMGLCRGLSFLLGAAVAHPPVFPAVSVAVAFGFVTAYIASVTRVARSETRAEPERMSVCVPFLVVIVGAFSFISVVIEDRDQAIALFLMFAWMALLTGMTAWRLLGAAGPVPVPAHVGALIGGVILIQAFLVFGAGATLVSWIAGAVLIALWPVNRLLGRWFYAS